MEFQIPTGPASTVTAEFSTSEGGSALAASLIGGMSQISFSISWICQHLAAAFWPEHSRIHSDNQNVWLLSTELCLTVLLALIGEGTLPSGGKLYPLFSPPSHIVSCFVTLLMVVLSVFIVGNIGLHLKAGKLLPYVLETTEPCELLFCFLF